jgi:hypothetical protein
MLVTLMKNLGAKSLLKILPLHIPLLLADSIYADLKGGRAHRLLTTIRCLTYVIGNFRRIWLKRLVVQSSRKVGDEELFKHVMARVPLTEKLRERSRARL